MYLYFSKTPTFEVSIHLKTNKIEIKLMNSLFMILYSNRAPILIHGIVINIWAWDPRNQIQHFPDSSILIQAINIFW